MALVAFLRGVNVGGNRVFQPTRLAADLAGFDVTNIGAAGTFVVRGAIGQAALRAQILRRLKFQAEIIICDGRDVLDLVAADPFRDRPGPPETMRILTILSRRPRNVPALPVQGAAGNRWVMEVFDVRGRFVLSLWRRLRPTFIDPTRMVGDTSFGVVGTTRSWNTLVKIAAVLGFSGSKVPGFRA
jgi:uncharacterized protein (DUF1697 family)